MFNWFRRKKEKEPDHCSVDHHYHVWEEYERFNLTWNGNTYGIIITLRCKHCGDLKNHKATS